jgi:glycine cleavage system H protein
MILYAKDHEYVKLEGEIATIGISDYAQNALGDVVFIELPALGRKVKQGEETAVVESVKAASDIYAPVSGEVVRVNDKLENSPGTINEDPLSSGWLYQIRIADKAELAKLMDETAYQAFLETL